MTTRHGSAFQGKANYLPYIIDHVADLSLAVDWNEEQHDEDNIWYIERTWPLLCRRKMATADVYSIIYIYIYIYNPG